MEAALLVGALGDERRAGVHHADEVDADVGRAGRGVLLEVHELLGDGEAAAAVLDRPVEPGVAGVVQLALPRRCRRPGGPASRRAAAAGRASGTASSSQARTSVAEGLVGVGVAQVHGQPSGRRSNRRATAARSTLPESVRGSVVDDADLGRAARSGRARSPRWASRSSAVTSSPRAQLDGGDRHGAEARVVAADDGGAAHRGVALERGPHVVGPHLEAAADDRLVGPAEDPQEAVGVDAGEVGGADPPPSPSWAAFTSSRPSSSGPSSVPSSASTTRSSQPGWARPTLPRFVAQNRAWSARFQPATPPPNSVAA